MQDKFGVLEQPEIEIKEEVKEEIVQE